MYDTLVGRGGTPDIRVPGSRGHWSAKVERNWNCRCTGKAASEAVTRCAACINDVRSTDIRDSMVLDSLSPVLQRLGDGGNYQQKCNLLTCPATASAPGSPGMPRVTSTMTAGTPNADKIRASSKCHTGISAPGTPVLSRPAVSPLALKRLRAESTVSRPLSVSSIASSSSSSSGASSCSHRLGVPNKSSAYLASIESLEDASENERRKSGTGRGDRFKCNDSQASADSGVHSSCSVSPGRPRYYDPHLSYMDRVVMEIVETEGVYVKDLQDITEGYLHYWRAQPDFPIADRLTDLFGNIEDICHFNSSFLQELEQCGLDPVKVARCFVRNNAGFSVYTEYCTNYPRTVSSLTELMRQEGAVRLFRERQTVLQHTLPLGSYLLKPVQRILKYHLLLQNIVKQSVKDVVGYADIEDALAAMTGIAQHINDMKRRHEHAVRVQEIQSLLYGWDGDDLTTFGELCAEGTFRIYGAKALRHMFLFDKMLLITKKREENNLTYKAHIDCSNLMLIESVPGEPLSFHVIPFDNPRLQYTLQARNLEQKREWTLQLKRVILENYNAVIPSHARQLVMELGRNRTDDEILADRSVPKRQHSAPEYLERRKQDRRKSDAGFRSRLRRTRKSDAGSVPESQQKTNEIREVDEKPGTEFDSERRRRSEPLPQFEVTPILADPQCTTTDSSPTKRFAEDSPPIESPDKVSIDLNNVEEVENIEQIVGQLLMQNREFEKLLKRQKNHVNYRSRSVDVVEIRNETTDEEDDGIYETLLHVKLALTADSTDPDYVTLVCPSEKTSPFKKQWSLRQSSKQTTQTLRRTESFQCPDFPPLKLPITSEDSVNVLPTSPSVWLQQQGKHLATPSKKAGSLPRSFQMNVEGEVLDEAFKEARNSVERPFTIASDKPPNPMMYESMDRYCRPFPLPGETTEDESLTEAISTPGTSLDQINIHPDYRIYRSSVSSKVIKNVISTVGNKLSHLRLDLAVSDESKVLQWERKASRLMYLIARQCNKTIRTHLRNGKSSLNITQPEPTSPLSPILPVFKQGSSSLGARIANFDSSMSRVRPSRKAAALLGLEPDSLVSLSASFSSMTEIEPAIESEETTSVVDDTLSLSINKDVESDSSTDSFYERSFEAMDEELSRGDTVYSDQEECFSDDLPKILAMEDSTVNKKVPPPVPAKPKLKSQIEPEVVVVDEVFKRTKSIRERQRDLEQWRLRKDEEGDTSSQHSTASTVIEVDSIAETKRPAGWVRHVVGKLQSGNIKTDTCLLSKHEQVC